MRGHNAIVELRRMGKKPMNVHVFLLEPGDEPVIFLDPEDCLLNGFHPEVCVLPAEDIQMLDFRFLVGVIVHLSGANIDRLREAFQCIRRCNPARIIASGAAFFDTMATAATAVEKEAA